MSDSPSHSHSHVCATHSSPIFRYKVRASGSAFFEIGRALKLLPYTVYNGVCGG